jgi:dihydrofolate synthase/folylpolyglutamate synthase
MQGVNYEDAVTYMSGLLQFGIRLDRERFVALLDLLGNPHKALRCIHVAGTNGKGSTTTFIASILRAAGYRTGAYFSPYVFDLRERIQIDGAMIPREDFARLVSEIRPHIEAIATDTDLGETTEFELKTAVAFRYFAQKQVDFAVIEVGIGGRLDATNVIDAPLVAVITNIGLDHTTILGDTLAKIAFEKAGILKPGAIAVTATAPGEARDTIATVAAERGVPMLLVEPEDRTSGRAFATFAPQADSVARITLRGTDRLYALGLSGAYQAANAATAVAAIEVLRAHRRIEISEKAVETGLRTAYIPGRFEIARPGSEIEPMLILDGAHNEDGARVLRQALEAQFGSDRKYVFVIGSRGNHPPGPFLRAIGALAARVIATEPPFKPTPAADTAAAARALGLQVTVGVPATAAIREAYAQSAPGEIVVVTGSLYVAGETPEELRGR